jgi:hypothetical protein
MSGPTRGRGIVRNAWQDPQVLSGDTRDMNQPPRSTSRRPVLTLNDHALNTIEAECVKKMLHVRERSALTTNTGGSYRSINTAVTGRNRNSSSTKAVLMSSNLRGINRDRWRNHAVATDEAGTGWRGP